MRAESSGGDEFGKSCGIIASNPRVRNACASTVIVTGRVVVILLVSGTVAVLEFSALVDVVVGVFNDFEWSS